MRLATWGIEFFRRHHRADVPSEAAILEDRCDLGVAGEESEIPGSSKNTCRLRRLKAGIGGIGIVEKPFLIRVELRRIDQVSPLR